MTAATNMYCLNPAYEKKIFSISAKTERKFLKIFLLGRLHQFFCELFKNKIQLSDNDSAMECYSMDSKIIQFLIQDILATGEYTLEGIAYYTRIPFDVIYDAACGVNHQFTITPWAKVIDLYLQVKPDVASVLTDRLLAIKEKNQLVISELLTQE